MEINLVAPPLSLPLQKNIPPPPVFSYKKLSDGTIIKLAAVNNKIDISNDDNDNNNENENESIEVLFEQFWESEYPRLGESKLIEIASNLSKNSSNIEDLKSNDKKNDRNNDSSGGNDNKNNENGANTGNYLFDDGNTKNNEITSNKNNSHLNNCHQSGFSSWLKNNRPSEGWEILPNVDQFRSILLPKIENSACQSTFINISDDSENLIIRYKSVFGMNEDTENDNESSQIQARKDLIEMMKKKYDVEVIDENENIDDVEKLEEIKSDAETKNKSKNEDDNRNKIIGKIVSGKSKENNAIEDKIGNENENENADEDSRVNNETEKYFGQNISDIQNDNYEGRKEKEKEERVEKEEGEQGEEGEKEEIEGREEAAIISINESSVKNVSNNNQTIEITEDKSSNTRYDKKSESEKYSESDDDNDIDDDNARNENNFQNNIEEENGEMVYSRIHGYRIRMPANNDSKSFYKKILKGLREVKKFK